VLLVGIIGGIAIGSVTAADRTASSFDVFLKSTNPSDISVILYGPDLISELARLPHVRQVDSVTYGLNPFPKGPDPVKSSLELMNGDVTAVGTFNGEYIVQDKVAVVGGRTANPRKADEFVMTAEAERLMGWRVGETIPMAFFSNAQVSRTSFNPAKAQPQLSIAMHLVGTVVLNNEVVSDEVNQFPARMIFTPALTRPLAGNSEGYVDYSLKLDHDAQDVSAVEREIIAALPKGTTYQFLVTSVYSGEVNRSVEPEAIALGVFGMIAALAALIIVGGLIARELQSDDGDFDLLRSLGGNPLMIAVASLVGPLVALVAGALLAVVVGVGLSPLSPIGPVRAVYPERGIVFDWPILASGFAIIILTLGSLAVVLARRRAQRVLARKRRFAIPQGSKLARLAAESGLPVTAVLGVRFALGSERRSEAVSGRSALLGAVVAIVIVVATLTFGGSLSTLVTHPALYGWNWNYAIASSGSVPPQSTRLLDSDPYVAAWSGVNLANAQINGLTVPILLADSHAAVSPPLLSGHEVDAADQIVLGAATMQALHEHVGGTVTASYGTSKDAPVYVPPTRLLIVGTTTLPAVGGAFSLHTSMGTGAILPIGVEPEAFRAYLTSPYPALNGKQMVFIRLRNGAPNMLARASLQTILEAGNRALAAVPNGEGSGDFSQLLKVQYPAEIENYQLIGATPVVLALGLALGAVVALSLTLVTSVRRKRRDLALLRSFGFIRRQLMATIAWQASVVGVIGVVIGIPLGILLGRWLWTLFARSIYAVPEPTVSLFSIFIVALSALVLVNLVAALPGRIAARTATAQMLRDE
jgi:energy-converting hydrogenase Eha subunit A